MDMGEALVQACDVTEDDDNGSESAPELTVLTPVRYDIVELPNAKSFDKMDIDNHNVNFDDSSQTPLDIETSTFGDSISKPSAEDENTAKNEIEADLGTNSVVENPSIAKIPGKRRLGRPRKIKPDCTRNSLVERPPSATTPAKNRPGRPRKIQGEVSAKPPVENESPSSATPGRSRYGRVRKPKLSADFVSVDRKSFAVLNSSSYEHVPVDETSKRVPDEQKKRSYQRRSSITQMDDVSSRTTDTKENELHDDGERSSLEPKELPSVQSCSIVNSDPEFDDSSRSSLNAGAIKTYSRKSDVLGTSLNCEEKPKEPNSSTVTQLNYPELNWKVGDVAWAKIGCQPYWPSIVTLEYGTSIYVKPVGKRMNRLAVHVQFFGDRGRRSWVLTTSLINYESREQFMELKRKYKMQKDKIKLKYFFMQPRYTDLWDKAVVEADTILKLPHEERIQYYQSLYPVSEDTYAATTANSNKVKRPLFRRRRNPEERRGRKRKILNGLGSYSVQKRNRSQMSGVAKAIPRADSDLLSDAKFEKTRKPIDEHTKKRRAFMRRMNKILKQSNGPSSADKKRLQNGARSRSKMDPFNKLLIGDGPRNKKLIIDDSNNQSSSPDLKNNDLSVYDFDSDEETDVFIGTYNSRFTPQILSKIEAKEDDVVEPKVEVKPNLSPAETESKNVRKRKINETKSNVTNKRMKKASTSLVTPSVIRSEKLKTSSEQSIAPRISKTIRKAVGAKPLAASRSIHKSISGKGLVAMKRKRRINKSKPEEIARMSGNERAGYPGEVRDSSGDKKSENDAKTQTAEKPKKNEKAYTNFEDFRLKCLEKVTSEYPDLNVQGREKLITKWWNDREASQKASKSKQQNLVLENDLSSESDESKSEEVERRSSSPQTIRTSKMKRSFIKIFPGLKADKVCQLCEKPGYTTRCRGPCSGHYHMSCVLAASKGLAVDDPPNSTLVSCEDVDTLKIKTEISEEVHPPNIVDGLDVDEIDKSTGADAQIILNGRSVDDRSQKTTKDVDTQNILNAPKVVGGIDELTESVDTQNITAVLNDDGVIEQPTELLGVMPNQCSEVTGKIEQLDSATSRETPTSESVAVTTVLDEGEKSDKVIQQQDLVNGSDETVDSNSAITTESDCSKPDVSSNQTQKIVESNTDNNQLKVGLTDVVNYGVITVDLEKSITNGCVKFPGNHTMEMNGKISTDTDILEIRTKQCDEIQKNVEKIDDKVVDELMAKSDISVKHQEALVSASVKNVEETEATEDESVISNGPQIDLTNLRAEAATNLHGPPTDLSAETSEIQSIASEEFSNNLINSSNATEDQPTIGNELSTDPDNLLTEMTDTQLTAKNGLSIDSVTLSTKANEDYPATENESFVSSTNPMNLAESTEDQPKNEAESPEEELTLKKEPSDLTNLLAKSTEDQSTIEAESFEKESTSKQEFSANLTDLHRELTEDEHVIDVKSPNIKTTAEKESSVDLTSSTVKLHTGKLNAEKESSIDLVNISPESIEEKHPFEKESSVGLVNRPADAVDEEAIIEKLDESTKEQQSTAKERSPADLPSIPTESTEAQQTAKVESGIDSVNQVSDQTDSKPNVKNFSAPIEKTKDPLDIVEPDPLNAVETEAGSSDVSSDSQSNSTKTSSSNGVDFRCHRCARNQMYPCFGCGKEVQDKTGETQRYNCYLATCGRVYHKECLKSWPQASWGGSAKETLRCPQHYCHTCISDNPACLKNKHCNEILVRCIKCPTAYHKRVHCIPAGTEMLTMSQIICPRHYEAPGIRPPHFNTSWCFICCIGGSLICCDECPTSFHAECLKLRPEEYEDKYICDDCQTGRYLLYGEICWVKLGHYRWWPARILFPNEIPENISNLPHRRGEFAVLFFGSHDYNWANRGRAFLYQEGDSGKKTCRRSHVDALFQKAMEEAEEAYKKLQVDKAARDEAAKVGLKPPRYVRIKANKPVGNVRIVEFNTSNISACECDPKSERPCAPDSDCLNRMLLVECNPLVCPAGERCLNQAFEKRVYPPLMPYKTDKRGWGLKTLVDMKKGDFIIEYVGEMIDEEEYERRVNIMHKNQEDNYYFLTIDKDRMLDAGPKGNVARFMNHSCEPNCETQKWTVNGDTRVGLFAAKNIPANTELVFNYNLVTQNNEMKPCYCGSKNCSGYIGVKSVKNGNSSTDDETRKRSNDESRKRSSDDANGAKKNSRRKSRKTKIKRGRMKPMQRLRLSAGATAAGALFQKQKRLIQAQRMFDRRHAGQVVKRSTKCTADEVVNRSPEECEGLPPVRRRERPFDRIMQVKTTRGHFINKKIEALYKHREMFRNRVAQLTVKTPSPKEPKIERRGRKKTPRNEQEKQEILFEMIKRRIERKFQVMSALCNVDETCFICGIGGELLLCDNNKCPRGYHLQCVDKTKWPTGYWLCPWHYCNVCQSKKKLWKCSYCVASFCSLHKKRNMFPKNDGYVCRKHKNMVPVTSTEGHKSTADPANETASTRSSSQEAVSEVEATHVQELGPPQPPASLISESAKEVTTTSTSERRRVAPLRKRSSVSAENTGRSPMARLRKRQSLEAASAPTAAKVRRLSVIPVKSADESAIAVEPAKAAAATPAKRGRKSLNARPRNSVDTAASVAAAEPESVARRMVEKKRDVRDRRVGVGGGGDPASERGQATKKLSRTARKSINGGAKRSETMSGGLGQLDADVIREKNCQNSVAIGGAGVNEKVPKEAKSKTADTKVGEVFEQTDFYVNNDGTISDDEYINLEVEVINDDSN